MKKPSAPHPRLEPLPVARLVPYARNARTHSPAQVAQIAASIREFGFTNPVLIDGEDGIIAGHGRVLAAQQLGLETVPCIRLAHLTESQKRAYILADNKLALNSGWDEALLAEEIAALEELGWDIESTGFSADELDQLLGDFTGSPDIPENDAHQAQSSDDTEQASGEAGAPSREKTIYPVLAYLTRPQWLKFEAYRKTLGKPSLSEAFAKLVETLP